MKLKANTQAWVEHLYRVQGITSGKTTMPSLAHVLLRAEGNEVVLQATDLDLALEDRLTAEVSEPGTVALPAKNLFEVLKTLPSGEVTISLGENQRVDVRAQKTHFRLVGLAAKEFPALPSATATEWLEVGARDIAEMIDSTLFCVSTDDARYNLSGIYFEAAPGDVLRMVATDGHRLAMIEREMGSKLHDKGVIVPRRALVELRRVLGSPAKEDRLTYGFSDNHAVFKFREVTLTSRLIDGQFPDYEQVIPKNSSKQVKVARQELAEALRRVSLLSPDKSFGVKLELGENTIRVTSQNPTLGEAEQEVSAEYTGPALTIGFNAHYVLEALSMVVEGGVVLEMSDELSPALLRPLESKQFAAVVMPMRI